MTALWTLGLGWGAGSQYDGDGAGDGWNDGDGAGDGWSSGDGRGDGWGSERNGYGSECGNRNVKKIFGYPEQDYDGCTAISRLHIHEARLPVADLLTLAVAR